MNYGIKISRPGYDVTDLTKNNTNNSKESSKATPPQMLMGLALPYLHGARTQLERYRHTASRLDENPALATVCLHDVSSLFEDLNAVRKYIEACDLSHELHKPIHDIRDHIRHDLRENLDHETHDGRRKRARKLGIDERLITSIGFDQNSIKVGNEVLSIDDIATYLSWAEGEFEKIIKEAKDKGLIEGVSFNNEE